MNSARHAHYPPSNTTTVQMTHTDEMQHEGAANARGLRVLTLVTHARDTSEVLAATTRVDATEVVETSVAVVDGAGKRNGKGVRCIFK